jgi:hypothetical protein
MGSIQMRSLLYPLLALGLFGGEARDGDGLQYFGGEAELEVNLTVHCRYRFRVIGCSAFFLLVFVNLCRAHRTAVL